MIILTADSTKHNRSTVRQKVNVNESSEERYGSFYMCGNCVWMYACAFAIQISVARFGVCENCALNFDLTLKSGFWSRRFITRVHFRDVLMLTVTKC